MAFNTPSSAQYALQRLPLPAYEDMERPAMPDSSSSYMASEPPSGAQQSKVSQGLLALLNILGSRG